MGLRVLFLCENFKLKGVLKQFTVRIVCSATVFGESHNQLTSLIVYFFDLATVTEGVISNFGFVALKMSLTQPQSVCCFPIVRKFYGLDKFLVLGFTK